MSIDRDSHIVVTGGDGFLGNRLVKRFRDKGYARIFVPRHEEYDLRNVRHIARLYKRWRPHIVIHLAARVGGIGANMKYPGEYFYDNVMMGVQMMEYARQYKVKKFVAIGTICAYPKFAMVPFKEDDLWKGYPEETNAAYGMAKKMLLVQAQAYRAQYGFNAIYLLPVNLYGPGDNFHPEDSHVIPAIIRKCFEAIRQKKKEIILWGTGTATREFLYVDDCAEAILLAVEKYNGQEPVNIGTGIEMPIKEIAARIAQLTGFKGKIKWDKTKPDGQPRRCLDTSRAAKLFGFRAKTDLETGLQKTIDWYKNNPEKIRENKGRKG